MRLEETEKRFLALSFKNVRSARQAKKGACAVEVPISLPAAEDIDTWEEQQITNFCRTLAASYPRTLLKAIATLVEWKRHTAEDLSATIRGCPGPSLEERRRCLTDVIGMR